MKTCKRCGKQTDMPFHTCSKPLPTDEQLNLAMCEWMGWTFSSAEDDPEICWRLNGRYGVLPNYLSDDSPRQLLNEAEARLTEDQQIQFIRELWKIVPQLKNDKRDYGNNVKLSYFAMCRATARQRVIAILQTVKPEMFQ